VRVRVTLASQLADYAGGEKHLSVEVDGDGDGASPTVAAVLDAVGARHPGVRDRALDDQGALRRHVNVFVNQENVRFMGGLQAPVNDGAEVSIFPAVSGGCGSLHQVEPVQSR
jgi:molybdopterin converting factor small subunit